MDTYVFANQKGGVDKTTMMLGVAAALAARRVRVMLIDLDAQASASFLALQGIVLGAFPPQRTPDARRL